MHDNMIRVLFMGDLVGIPGRALLKKHIVALKKKYAIDFTIVNGENSASDGRGITPRIVTFFKEHGADVVTTGNHIWAKKDIVPFIGQQKFLLRPANFPTSCPGTGVTLMPLSGGYTIGVINVQGRVFMRELVDCPLRTVESALTYLRTQTNMIFIDIHAETSSEKIGLASYFDGRVSAVVGTHTHVQTADERILPGGTAFITDAGMGGALHSMIGMNKEILLRQQLTQMPVKFEVETRAPYQLCGVVVSIDPTTGKAQNIERVRLIDPDFLDLDDPELKDK